jgi:hypothetical protein
MHSVDGGPLRIFCDPRMTRSVAECVSPLALSNDANANAPSAASVGFILSRARFSPRPRFFVSGKSLTCSVCSVSLCL